MARHPRATDVVQTDDQALAALTAAGYTAVVGLTHHGHVWVGSATDATGAAVDVVVHGKTGKISVDPADEPTPAP